MTSAPRCDRTVAWAALAGHFEGHGRPLVLTEAFAADPSRFARFAVQAPEVFADLSKQHWDAQAQRLLLELARECRLEERRDALLRGAVVNTTEGRAALHTALRAPPGSAPFSAEVHAALDAMLALAEQVRAPASGFDDVVHIGIGGSALGPQMAVQALAALAPPRPRLHFIANVDGQALATLLPRLVPERTLFIVASKTFTTQETMANAATAKAWFTAQCPGADAARHFVGLTANVAAATAFGVRQTLPLWDWVGGRFSLWSTIGLPIAIAIGAEGFRALLAGAHAMDRHFAETPLQANLPVLLALLDIWQRNFHRRPTRCMAPYHAGLARLPAFLQQLEMESNGKGVDLAGEPLPFATSPVVWGEPGTDAQHAYFQMLHQGSDTVPVEFIAVREPIYPALAASAALREHLAAQHQLLLANCLAQSQALMLGKPAEPASVQAGAAAAQDVPAAALARHRACPGNRPSTTLVLHALTPRALGALLALYEHRTATCGLLWGINPFDQWGVELGKALSHTLAPRLASGDVAGLDGSTAGLITHLRQQG